MWECLIKKRINLIWSDTGLMEYNKTGIVLMSAKPTCFIGHCFPPPEKNNKVSFYTSSYHRLSSQSGCSGFVIHCLWNRKWKLWPCIKRAVWRIGFDLVYTRIVCSSSRHTGGHENSNACKKNASSVIPMPFWWWKMEPCYVTVCIALAVF